jgi:hypothetical protein
LTVTKPKKKQAVNDYGKTPTCQLMRGYIGANHGELNKVFVFVIIRVLGYVQQTEK